ncbi:MAG: hypothetical protein IT181_03115 [Acidobacteria bacterium]|nr:hypothetical protein [Acidobacteriota bacterium]
MRPLAALLAVVTTVTTPAVLAACLALCMPGMRGHVMAMAAAPTASVATPEVGCPDHGAAAPTAPGVTLTASGAACCVDALTAAAPAVAAERADTRAGAADALTPVLAWTSAPLLRADVRVAHDRGSPPPPLRRVSVLRI